VKRPGDDIESTTPVWFALQDFFLDSDQYRDAITRAYVIRVCAASPYSLQELDQILFGEAWSALSWNLASYAGQWDGWSRESLQKRVLEKCRGPSKLWWLNPTKLIYRSVWRWSGIREGVELARSRVTS
jgi:hypothetical protein